MPRYSSIGLLCFLTVECSNEDNVPVYHFVDNNKQQLTTGRWYSKQQVNTDKIIFANHCADYHGQNAEATSH